MIYAKSKYKTIEDFNDLPFVGGFFLLAIALVPPIFLVFGLETYFELEKETADLLNVLAIMVYNLFLVDKKINITFLFLPMWVYAPIAFLITAFFP